MSAESCAKMTLAAYIVLAGVTVAWQAIRCPEGPAVWGLYAAERLYCGLWYHWRANRRCPFPNSGPALIVANHRCPVDPLFLWMNHHLGPHGPRPIRVIGFLMAREYYNQPGLRWLCRTVKTIPIDRDRPNPATMRAALRRLQSGRWLGLFPEGQINLGEELMPGNKGVAWLVLRARVPVFPVYIHNAPGGRNMIEPFYTRSRVRITYGDPIDLSRFYRRRLSDDVLDEATDVIMSRLSALASG